MIGGVNSFYVGKSTLFKVFLLVGVVAISIVFIWYTFSVIDRLKYDTRSQVERYVRLWQLAANSNMTGTELQFIFDEVIVKATFPIIVLDNNRQPIHHRNVEDLPDGENTAATREYLKRVADQMVRQNGEYPLIFATETDTFINYFCYGDSDLIEQLRIMPFIMVGIISAFMIVAIIGFQNIRRSEERHIWVGMAKETAHQLGTPISSLLGWIEVMRSERDSAGLPPSIGALIDDTVDNMTIDTERLEKVANRFGKIGSIPDLQPADLNAAVGDAVEYYRRRLPFEGKGIRLEFTGQELPPVNLNLELFGWAIENMIKNSLQAVDSRTGEVALATRLHDNGRWAVLEIADNGRGIPPGAARKVFRAGFTTKKRGWGLGLTLVKRIIEEYHRGRISLKRSKPGETVFTILLPLAGEKGAS